MRAFWIQLSTASLTATALYGSAIALSGTELPWQPRPFDTGVTTSTEPGWVNEARYVMLNKDAFAAPRDRIVILGASTSRDPFRPQLMEAALPGWEVANASLSGANVSEISDAVDLYYDVRGTASGKRTVFVFALTYLQFKPVKYAPGSASPFATEAMRGGQYARQNGALVAQLPDAVEAVEQAAFRPQAIVASWPRRLAKSLFGNPDLPQLKALADRFRATDPLSRWTQAMGEARDLNALTPPPEMQRALLAQRLADGGDTPYPDDEFVKLAATLRKIRAHGDLAVIADLPLPAWHRAGVPKLEAANDARIDAILGNFKRDPAISRVSLREFGRDENFFDSGHPKPRMWPVMSARLAARLQPFLAANQSDISQARK